MLVSDERSVTEASHLQSIVCLEAKRCGVDNLLVSNVFAPLDVFLEDYLEILVGVGMYHQLSHSPLHSESQSDHLFIFATPLLEEVPLAER